MVESRIGFWCRTGGMLVGAGLLALSGAALATDQSQQRQQGRDANTLLMPLEKKLLSKMPIRLWHMPVK